MLNARLLSKMFVIRQFCPVEVEILVREADIVGPP